MESATAHRKIELQSPEDFTYLINNVRRGAAESIAAAFPPVEGAAKDELHARVEELVNDYITQTFTLATPNLSINGLPITDTTAFLSPPQPNTTKPPRTAAAATPAFEPFDGRKRQRVEDLAREEEDLLRDIAELKRGVPGAAAAAYAAREAAGVAADEAALEGATSGVKREGGGDGGDEPGVVGIGRLERQEEVERAFADVVETLGRLKGGMPATVARMERARVAGAYVVTEQ